MTAQQASRAGEASEGTTVIPRSPVVSSGASTEAGSPPGPASVPLIVCGLDLERLAARFWPKVDRRLPHDCWPWMAARHRSGYGAFARGGKSGGMVGAHQVAILLTEGRWPPKGYDVDHLCRRPCCVNPDHLQVVTHAENNRRGIAGEVNGARQRAITHCPRGHAYDEANTHVRPTGARRCRACARAERRARYLTSLGRTA